VRLLCVAEHLDLSNQLVTDLLATIDTAKQIKYLEPSLFDCDEIQSSRLFLADKLNKNAGK
jgi:exonuclease I